MDFKWWQIPLLLIAVYWQVTLLVVIVIAVVGFLLKGKARVVLLSIAGLPALAALGVGGYLLLTNIEEKHASRIYEADYAKRHVTLTTPTVIAGLALPAGTTVLYRDDTMSTLQEFDLPQPTVILGAKLVGHVDQQYEDFFAGTLAENWTVAGWPCKAGEIRLNPRGEVWDCTLAQEAVVASPTGAGALHVPEGTHLSLSPGSDTGYTLQIPDGKSMYLPDVRENVPAGNTVRLYLNHGERGVYASGDTPFSVRGIPFSTDVYFKYPDDVPDESNGPTSRPTEAFGEYQGTLVCDGVEYEGSKFEFAGIDLTTDSVVLEHATMDSDDNQKTKKIPASHCHVARKAADSE